MSNTIREYNTSSIVCNDTNICEAVETDDILRFNESYVVVGECLKAKEIFAMYDLTVMGDVQAEKIEVNGKLYVSGNIKADQIRCSSNVSCNGNILCESISGDSDLIANSVDAEKIEIYGNLMVTTSINVEKSCTVNRNILSGEGFSGNGELSTENLLTVDYFDFDGSVKGKVFEMETMFEGLSKSESSSVNDEKKQEFSSINDGLESFYTKYFDLLTENEEEDIVNTLKEAAQIQKIDFEELSFLFNEIVRISYLNGIDNLKDYLLAKCAVNVFPEKLINYETIEHVFSDFLDQVDVDELQFNANNVFEFMYSLKIIEKFFENDEELLDKVFSYVGIRYSTVKRQFQGGI